MKYTKAWIAYVDDLSVRTGRVVDGRFLTDEEADAEIKEACRRAPVEVGQPTSTALEAPRINPKGLGEKKGKHNPVVSDHNHSTRFVGSRFGSARGRDAGRVGHRALLDSRASELVGLG